MNDKRLINSKELERSVKKEIEKEIKKNKMKQSKNNKWLFLFYNLNNVLYINFYTIHFFKLTLILPFFLI